MQKPYLAIKKAELHVHLEGTITPNLAKKLAKRNQLTLPKNLISADGLSYSYQGFADFLKAYDRIAALIKQPRDYYDLTLDYLKTRAEENTLYVEMFYSPMHAELSSSIPSREHLQAIQQAIDEAETQFAIIGRIISTAVRHCGVEAAIQVAKATARENVPCVVGFGLGGDEINFPAKLFSKAYLIAAESGLGCTVHEGEFSSPRCMVEAIKNLPIQRIGHGVQAIHSSEALAALKDHNISLEICPSSNIALGIFKDLASHPLPRLREAGIRMSLGSDDPPFFRTTLAREYQLVQQAFHYSAEEMLAFTRIAIESAFVDAKTKSKLLAKLAR